MALLPLAIGAAKIGGAVIASGLAAYGLESYITGSAKDRLTKEIGRKSKHLHRSFAKAESTILEQERIKQSVAGLLSQGGLSAGQLAMLQQGSSESSMDIVNGTNIAFRLEQGIESMQPGLVQRIRAASKSGNPLASITGRA